MKVGAKKARQEKNMSLYDYYQKGVLASYVIYKWTIFILEKYFVQLALHNSAKE